MLIFRTLLLWMAFVLLLLLEIEFFPDLQLKFSLMFRLVPSILLAAWFLLNIFSKEKTQYSPLIKRSTIVLITWLKSIANIAILVGAFFKLLHLPYAQLCLVGGIGVLALWSSILARWSVQKSDYNPDIIDDMNGDEKED